MGASLLLLQPLLGLPLAACNCRTVESLSGKVSNTNLYFNLETLPMHLPNILAQLWPPPLARSHRRWRNTLNMASIAHKTRASAARWRRCGQYISAAWIHSKEPPQSNHKVTDHHHGRSQSHGNTCARTSMAQRSAEHISVEHSADYHTCQALSRPARAAPSNAARQSRASGSAHAPDPQSTVGRYHWGAWGGPLNEYGIHLS